MDFSNRHIAGGQPAELADQFVAPFSVADRHVDRRGITSQGRSILACQLGGAIRVIGHLLGDKIHG